jgi:hypothetical protein
VNAPLGSTCCASTGHGQEALEPGTGCCSTPTGDRGARRDGEFFGIERLVEYISREAAAVTGGEALRRLNLSILAHQEGELQDDATTVMIEWLTNQPRASDAVVDASDMTAVERRPAP